VVLAGVLAAGVAVSGRAQTTSPQSGATTQSPGGAAPATGGTATTPGSASTPPSGTTVPQMAPQTPPQPGGAPGGAAAAPQQATQGNAPAATAEAAPRETMSQMVDQRIADMRSQLHITHAQEPHWDRFAAVMRSNARALDRDYRRRGERLDSMSALENMESYARIERRRSTDVQRLVPAFRALYASLTPEQRHAADELFRERAEQRSQSSKR
jgi:hypothetical protein